MPTGGSEHRARVAVVARKRAGVHALKPPSAVSRLLVVKMLASAAGKRSLPDCSRLRVPRFGELESDPI